MKQTNEDYLKIKTIQEYLDLADDQEEKGLIHNALATLREAKSLYNAAAKNNTDFLLYYGTLLLKTESGNDSSNIKKVLKYFNRALELGNDFETCILLAKILIRHNKITQAHDYYDLACDLAMEDNPNFVAKLWKEYADLCYIKAKEENDTSNSYDLFIHAHESYDRILELKCEAGIKEEIHTKVTNIKAFLEQDDMQSIAQKKLYPVYERIKSSISELSFENKSCFTILKKAEDLYDYMSYLPDTNIFKKEVYIYLYQWLNDDIGFFKDYCAVLKKQDKKEERYLYLCGLNSSNPEIILFAKNELMKSVEGYDVDFPEILPANDITYLKLISNNEKILNEILSLQQSPYKGIIFNLFKKIIDEINKDENLPSLKRKVNSSSTYRHNLKKSKTSNDQEVPTSYQNDITKGRDSNTQQCPSI